MSGDSVSKGLDEESPADLAFVPLSQSNALERSLGESCSEYRISHQLYSISIPSSHLQSNPSPKTQNSQEESPLTTMLQSSPLVTISEDMSSENKPTLAPVISKLTDKLSGLTASPAQTRSSSAASSPVLERSHSGSAVVLDNGTNIGSAAGRKSSLSGSPRQSFTMERRTSQAGSASRSRRGSGAITTPSGTVVFHTRTHVSRPIRQYGSP